MTDCVGQSECQLADVVGGSFTFSGNNFGAVSGFISASCNFTARSGDLLFGCDGEPDSTTLGAPPGFAGVVCFSPGCTVSFSTSSPVSVFVSTDGTIATSSVQSGNVGSSLLASTVGSLSAAWPVFLIMSGFLVGLAVLRRVRRG